MRPASAAPVTSLLGSLLLHGGALALVVLCARKPAEVTRIISARPDIAQGSAIEVDQEATHEASSELARSGAEPANTEPRRESSEMRTSPATPPRRGTDALSKSAAAAPQPTTARPRERSKRGAAAAVSAGSPLAPTANSSLGSGSFGGETLPPGVRSLPSAFTRAIPPATAADPIWQRLPIGTQRSFILAVEVDGEGHIGSAQVLGAHDGGDIPEQFEHVRKRVIALLGGGLFALQNNATAGRDLFRITITLSDRPATDEGAPAELVERGFEPPRGRSPGRAYFTLASGRHFEARVEVLGAPARPKQP